MYIFKKLIFSKATCSFKMSFFSVRLPLPVCLPLRSSSFTVIFLSCPSSFPVRLNFLLFFLSCPSSFTVRLPFPVRLTFLSVLLSYASSFLKRLPFLPSSFPVCFPFLSIFLSILPAIILTLTRRCTCIIRCICL